MRLPLALDHFAAGDVVLLLTVACGEAAKSASWFFMIVERHSTLIGLFDYWHQQLILRRL